MNKEIEQIFIDNYIVSERQDRLSYELFGKKRREGIGRFCHSADSLIKKSTIVESGNHLTIEKIKTFADKSKGKYCYVISWDEDVDGTTMSADTFFDRNIGVGMPVIAIFDSFVIIETEQEYGAAERYILHDGRLRLELIEAMEEAKRISKDPNVKHYSSFDEVVEELL